MINRAIIDEILTLIDDYMLKSMIEKSKEFRIKRNFIIERFYEIVYELTLEQLKFLLEHYQLPKEMEAIVKDRIKQLTQSSQPDGYEPNM